MPLVDGTAVFSISSLTLGSHAITAAYSGDGNFSGSASAADPLVVNMASTTAVVLDGLSTSVYGDVAYFEAIVQATAPSNEIPTGTVTFEDGGTALSGDSTVALVNGTAIFSISSLVAGSHSINVVYSGDDNSTTSVSDPLSHTVDQADSTTTLVDSLNPSVYGQSVTFTAAVGSDAGVPTGTLTFEDGGRGFARREHGGPSWRRSLVLDLVVGPWQPLDHGSLQRRQ